MRCQPIVLALAIACAVAAPAPAADLARDAAPLPIRTLVDQGRVLHGGQPGLAKTSRDTTYLLGGPARTDGDFEAGWNGWTSVDFTAPAVSDEGYWQVSDFNAANLGGHGAGNHALWCGTEFEGDPGYGNEWVASVSWTGEPVGTHDDPVIRVTAWLNHDTEPGYDFLRLQILRDGLWDDLAVFDGVGSNVAVDVTTVLESTWYTLPLILRWLFESDANGSDEDGIWPTDGACQIDDLAVYRDGELVAFEDFEAGALEHWQEAVPVGVGDYAALYQNLQDEDACRSNYSRQVAFVDDGVVVPGTGGTPCITWCYGPGGFIVNNSGGLIGPDAHLRNGIISPAIALPAGLDGVEVAFDVYDALPDYVGVEDPGIYHNWRVRSTAAEDPSLLEEAEWRDRALFYQGTMRYERGGGFVSDLLVDGARWMQLCLEVAEWGYLYGIDGFDGHPAPYFDNAAVKAYDFVGPFLTTREVDLAQDTFPALGDIDYGNLGNNSCRFDMARNISPAVHLRNDPGDSLTVVVQPRSGGALVGDPRMIVSMWPNPLYGAVRILPPGFSVTPDQKIKGTVTGRLVDAASDLYAFDLPDTGFFFPGDEIHYFFEAADERAGEPGLTRLPADTTGFDRFTGNQAVHTVFPPEFIVRALPTMFSAIPGDQPRVLLWDDGGDRDETLRWRWSLADLGYNEGGDYDLYETRSPASGVGNGLGGRAASAQLAAYSTLLYACGDLGIHTLANGDYQSDPSRDLVVVSNWFARGAKNAFMTGNNLVSGLLGEGAQGQAFVNTYFNVNFIDRSVRVFIGDQYAPLVKTIQANGIVVRTDRWIAYGGCPDLADLDAVENNAGTVRVAEFTDPNGNGGVYNYAAMSHYRNDFENARVVMMPYRFDAIHNAPGWQPPIGYPARARSVILEDILDFFGESGGLQPIAAPDAKVGLAVSAHPNPFNPRCTIALRLPRAAEVSVKVYDLRGALVRTLQQGRLAAGRHDFSWAGEDERGAASASGVYFYEVRAGGERRLGKLTLVK